MDEGYYKDFAAAMKEIILTFPARNEVILKSAY
jgi:hypothetical protein